MIDPKFNDLPVKKEQEGEDISEASLTEEQKAERLKRARGLSINDTVAGDANLSVGSRGVDTSGVRAGSGAGAGSTYTTPASRGESPNPTVVPGPRASGTTTLGNASPDQSPTLQGDPDAPTSEEIKARAYQYWNERGCPEGSHDEDWRRAERELREERLRLRSSKATA